MKSQEQPEQLNETRVTDGYCGVIVAGAAILQEEPRRPNRVRPCENGYINVRRSPILRVPGVSTFRSEHREKYIVVFLATLKDNGC